MLSENPSENPSEKVCAVCCVRKAVRTPVSQGAVYDSGPSLFYTNFANFTYTNPPNLWALRLLQPPTKRADTLGDESCFLHVGNPNPVNSFDNYRLRCPLLANFSSTTAYMSRRTTDSPWVRLTSCARAILNIHRRYNGWIVPMSR
jgi:hypothetical protein